MDLYLEVSIETLNSVRAIYSAHIPPSTIRPTNQKCIWYGKVPQSAFDMETFHSKKFHTKCVKSIVFKNKLDYSNGWKRGKIKNLGPKITNVRRKTISETMYLVWRSLESRSTFVWRRLIAQEVPGAVCVCLRPRRMPLTRTFRINRTIGKRTINWKRKQK